MRATSIAWPDLPLISPQGFGEKLDDRRVADSVGARQLAFTHSLAVEIDCLARPPDIQLHDLEVGFDVVPNLRDGEVHQMHFPAVGTAIEFPQQRQALSLDGRFLKVIGKLEKTVEEPSLGVGSELAVILGRGHVPAGRGQDARDTLGEKTAAERLLFPGRCNPIALPSFVKGSAQINAFASDLIFRPLPNELDPPPTGTVPDPGFQEKKGRIFVTVRGNESLTFADVDSNDPEDPIAELLCGETSFGGKCSKVYSRGEEGDDRDENDRFTDLPPEPNAVAANLRGEVLVVAHQTQPTSSLFINDWLKWGEAGASTGPQLKFLAGGLPENAIDVISMPEPRYMLEHEVDYRPAFLLTFRTAAQLVSLRYFADDSETEPSRPFLTVGGRVDITANSVNWDSRGIAIDTDARTQCETACDPPLPDPPPEPPPVPPTPEELKSCLRTCTNVPLGVFVANRTPSSLLIGQTRPNATPTSNDDLPQIYDSIPLSTGPSRVVTGQIRVADPEFPDDPKKFKAATRVFVVCFDSRLIYIYDPTLQRIESIIRTGRGPYALSIGRILDATTRASEPTGLGYVGMFTDSYVGVVDLDQRHKETYGTIIMTLGNPVVPRASE